MDRKRVRRIIRKGAVAISGAFIGVANAIFGGGGGMLAVPMLASLENMEQKKSHATALALILPLTLITVIVYTLQGQTDFKLAYVASLGVTFGGVLGAMLLNKSNNQLISTIFYLLMIIGGIKMIIA